MKSTYLTDYESSVRKAFASHLAAIGFSLKKERFGVLVAQSAITRIVFNPAQGVPFVQRLVRGSKDVGATCSLNVILKASGSETEYQAVPVSGAEMLSAELDRVASLLARECRPALDGDDAAWQRAMELAGKEREDFFDNLSKSGVRIREDGHWRELPELECVKAKGASRGDTILLWIRLIGSLLLTIICVPLAVYDLFWPHSADDGPPALFGMLLAAIMTAVLVATVKSLPRIHYYWQTGPLGLSFRGLLKKEQSVSWADIQSARILPDLGYEFRTAKGIVRLGKGAARNTALEASIWQHLNRVGKAENLQLSGFGASLWAVVPDEKGYDIHWENSKQRDAADILLKFACGIMATVAVICLVDKYQGMVWGVLYPATAVVALLIQGMISGLIGIKSVSVSDAGIEAVTALGRSEIPWDAVRAVKFLDSPGKQPPSLKIEAKGRRSIRIPWIPNHPNSTRVMLAILRRLRQEDRFKLLPFPTILLMASQQGSPE